MKTGSLYPSIAFPYLVLDAVFEGGRLFVGATSAAYLLSQGVSLSQIALLKSLQAIVILFGEVPTGIFADLFGRRKSLLLSLFVATFGFILYFSSHHFAVYLLAEVLVALSLCFWSGAFEAYAIENAQLESEPGRMDKFFHLNQSINSGAVLVFGFFGGILGESGLGLPYLGAALVSLFCLIWLLPLPACQVRNSQARAAMSLHALYQHTKNAFAHGFLSKKLAPFFGANVAIQFAIQPLFQFWQPLFQSLDKSVTSETLGQIFTLYCGSNLLFGALASRCSNHSFFRSPGFSVALFSAFGFSYFLIGNANSLAPAIVFFCLAQGTLSVARTSLGVRFNEAISGLPRATVLSSLSLVSRIGQVGALGTLSITAHVSGEVSQQTYFMGFGATALLLTLAAGIFVLSEKSTSELGAKEQLP